MRGSTVRVGLYEGSTERGGLYEGFRCEGWPL